MGKVMNNLRYPMFDQLTRPVSMYFDNTDGTKTNTRATGGKKNAEVMDDLDYAIKTRNHSRKISCYNT